ncbi:hypothetical protein [Polynucleobacter sphagniphilus]|jgi:hypothetical protein|uniref:hypothetical protein n=1 Tax=Polynucleobacter sphagniphilus TaxID=1743169 RepID=UPI001BFE29B8|nr:hypothetical protein [Polynucleobacter sphagniphilus]MBT8582964.1 hypothetical protein [Polynucleobacter paneuropaeus]MBT8611606.1 hypothetical protein [Polynucleobacter paneuropaeus]MDH6249766.1 hypothetical protein [Polynucleobacter sphagniphilus]MDH6300011.1 hypothetical protein [Polynucleobacter sphagniphilus]
MTKYVNQDVYDASLMLIAAHKLETKSELEYQNMIWQLVAYYEKDYSGDYSFKTDLEKGVETVIKNFGNTRDGDLIRAFKSGAELRMQLDDNMQKKSTLKKFFGGTAFTSGHPNPSTRLSSGVTNVTRILDAVLGK